MTDYSDGNNRYWIGIRRKTEAELENECHTVEGQAELSERPYDHPHRVYRREKHYGPWHGAGTNHTSPKHLL